MSSVGLEHETLSHEKTLYFTKVEKLGQARFRTQNFSTNGPTVWAVNVARWPIHLTNKASCIKAYNNNFEWTVVNIETIMFIYSHIITLAIKDIASIKITRKEA